MTEFNTRLSAQEQSYTEQRIVHDAWLIKGGARIHELGHLVVTESQRELLMERERASPEAWLETDLLVAYELAYPERTSLDTRVLNQLSRKGLINIRSVLAVGLSKAASGRQSEQKLRPLLVNSYSVEVFDLEPPAEYVATICDTLEDVPGRRVHNRVLGGYSVDDVLTLAARGVDEVRSIVDYTRMRSTDEDFTEEVKVEIVKDIIEAAKKFEAQFIEAKTRA